MTNEGNKQFLINSMSGMDDKNKLKRSIQFKKKKVMQGENYMQNLISEGNIELGSKQIGD
jgi:hypothetical protein